MSSIPPTRGRAPAPPRCRPARRRRVAALAPLLLILLTPALAAAQPARPDGPPQPATPAASTPAAAPAAGIGPMPQALPPRLVEGQPFAQRLRLGEQDLLLNGTGVRAVAWFKGYAAGLYLARRAATPDEVLATPGAKRIQLRMLQAVPAGEFAKAFRKGVSRNSGEPELALLAARMAQFESAVLAIGKVRPGDVVDLDFVPGSGTLLQFNGRAQAAPLAGADFYAALLRAFVGPRPYDERLKAGLLGRPEAR